MNFNKIMFILHVFMIAILIVSTYEKNIFKKKTNNLNSNRRMNSINNFQNYNSLNRSLLSDKIIITLIKEFKDKWYSNSNKNGSITLISDWKKNYFQNDFLNNIKSIHSGQKNNIYLYKKELIIRQIGVKNLITQIKKSFELQSELKYKLKEKNIKLNIAEIITYDNQNGIAFMNYYKSSLNEIFNYKILTNQQLLVIFEKCKELLIDIHKQGFVFKNVQTSSYLLLNKNFDNLDSLRNDIYISDFDNITKYYYDDKKYFLDDFLKVYINFKLIGYNYRTEFIYDEELYNEEVDFEMLKKLDVSALALMFLYKKTFTSFNPQPSIKEIINLQNKLFKNLNDKVYSFNLKENIFKRILDFIINLFKSASTIKEEKLEEEAEEKLLLSINKILN